MKGFQLSFFTQQDRRHDSLPLAEWLLKEARRLGVRGATLFTAAEGFGQNRKIRSMGFFELADQPMEITMAVSAEEAEKLFAILNEENIRIFYVKTPVEYGVTGETGDIQT